MLCVCVCVCVCVCIRVCVYVYVKSEDHLSRGGASHVVAAFTITLFLTALCTVAYTHTHTHTHKPTTPQKNKHTHTAVKQPSSTAVKQLSQVHSSKAVERSAQLSALRFTNLQCAGRRSTVIQSALCSLGNAPAASASSKAVQQ